MTQLVRILAVCAIAFLTVGPVGAATVHHALSISADATMGSVSGKVTESNGSPVANAAVKFIGPTTFSATTDAMGNFSANSVKPGIYSIQVSKSGYNLLTVDDFAVVGGTAGQLNATLQPVTFSTLREIGHVTARRATNFNTSTASVAVISAQNYTDQAQTQVMRILDQTPGIVTGHPSTTGNAASPGAITFANIRGGLSFETASLLDGHPLSVGRFGDYVVTFLDSSVLGSTEIVKGPGAYAPTINYAIGGTVNFRTIDPTRTPTGQIRIGFDSYGGTQDNFRYSNTFGNKLGVLFDYAFQDTPGPLNGFPVFSTLPGSGNNSAGSTFVSGTDAFGNPVSGYLKCPSGFTASGCTSGTGFAPCGPPAGYTGKFPIGNAINNPTAWCYAPLVASGYKINSGYKTLTELVKVRYDFSTATQLTLSYLGSQANIDQDGNTLQLQQATFTPCINITCTGANTGPLYPGNNTIANGGQFLLNTTTFRPPTHEVNNEPIFQGELRTTWGNDTLLGRFYAASINRLLTNGLNGPGNDFVTGAQLYGVACITPTLGAGCGGNTRIFTGQQVIATECGTHPSGPVATCTDPTHSSGGSQFFNQNEEDKLHGFSFQWQHPIGPNLLTLGYDTVHSLTRYTSGSRFGETINIPDGSGQTQNTFLVRGTVNTGKASITLSNYFNSYKTHFATFTGFSMVGGPVLYTFSDINSTHWDPRLGIAWQASPFLSLRASAGSAIAPPFINLYTVNASVSVDFSGTFASTTTPNPNLVPETAFGYNLGFDWRDPKDPATTLSVDGYLTNLHNQFITSNSLIGTCTPTTPNSNGACPITGIPLFANINQNLANARYEGLEMSLRRDPLLGLGYTANVALIKAYPYNLPPGFYTTGFNPFGTNLAVIPNINFQAGQFANGDNGVSNQSIPYSSAYGELHYRFQNGMYATVGTTYYGKNNSWNVNPFFIVNATLRGNLGNRYGDLNWQVSGDNLANALPNSYILVGAGVPNVTANALVGLQNQNAVGPRRFRFVITKNFGP